MATDGAADRARRSGGTVRLSAGCHSVVILVPSRMEPSPQAGGWQFWIDRGGTFTDVVARTPDGTLCSSKLLSDGGRHYDDAAIEGIRRQLHVATGAPLPLDRIAAVRMGTTVATNALLERKGARVGLLITAGFEDLLSIGDQSRPDLFALKIQRPTPLEQCRHGVVERIDAAGRVETPLQTAGLVTLLQQWRDSGIDSLAVVLLHSSRNPCHELAIAALARPLAFQYIALSHQVSPLPKCVVRGQTTVLDAYLTPPLQRYVQTLQRQLGDVQLQFMTSSGGLAEPARFTGSEAVLSGPAGGVIGAVQACRDLGRTRCIGFDMGGTSTDVFHWGGTLERCGEALIAGLRIQKPMLDINTVASGGGSVISWREGRLRVGPHSAGSNPGPACYGLGGPATITDANLLVGHLCPTQLPSCFGPGADARLDPAAAACAFGQLLRQAPSGAISADEDADEETALLHLARDALRIANEQMAQAIRAISIARGQDTRDSLLVAFGGAGGQHACEVAELLGISEIHLHPCAGVLSAWGIGQARLLTLVEKSTDLKLLDFCLPAQQQAFTALEALARERLGDADLSLLLSVERRLWCRHGRGEAEFSLRPAAPEAMVRQVQALHHERFGYRLEGVETLRVCRLQLSLSRPEVADAPPADAAVAEQGVLEGPALIPATHGTVVVRSGWASTPCRHGGQLLRRRDGKPREVPAGHGDRPTRATAAKPFSGAVGPGRAGRTNRAVLLELFQNRFMAVAREMGSALRESAQSLNIRERLDYSCALFDPSGRLVAHAPHIPVHLGSMGSAVRAAIALVGNLPEGDALVLNSPARGGTHLPDVTVIARAGTLGWVAARGHHVDIGGITPGSMPAGSTTLQDEGVVLDGWLVRNGVFLEADLRARLNRGRHPSRHPELNLMDLLAQLAAVRRGVAELHGLALREGDSRVKEAMAALLRLGRDGLLRRLHSLSSGQVRHRLDGGLTLALAIRPSADHLTLDFSGTSAQCPGNRNAPPAITHSAVLYVLRCLLGDGVPLNEGVMEPVTLVLPPGSLLDPSAGAAVVAGNVETSQAVVDLLMAGFGLQACSQGTMNNLTLGSCRGTYYETLCGGSGAGPGYGGCGGVHSHMTNSRLTDPEVLEAAMPLRLEGFGLRAGSGGDGTWRGGDGVERCLRALQPLTLSLLSSRRETAPEGLAGGGNGRCGDNAVQRRDGPWQRLAGDVQLCLAAGDRLRLRTPGGGGYGKASPQAAGDGSPQGLGEEARSPGS